MAILTEEEKKRRVALPTFDSPQSAAAALAGMQATARAQMAGQGALAPTQPAQVAAPGVRQDLGLTTFTSPQDAANALASMRTRARSQMAAQGALPSAAPAASDPAVQQPMSYGDQMKAVGNALLSVPKHIVSAPGYGFSALQDGPAAPAPQTPPVTTKPVTTLAGDATMPAYDFTARVRTDTAPATSQPGDAAVGEPLATAKNTGLTSNAIKFDPRTNTYSGTNIGPNATIVNGRQRGSYVGVGGNDAPGFGMPGAAGISSGAASAQRAADIYKSMAYGEPQQGVSVPTVLHSGNDWQSRNNLRNLEISASSMTNQPNAPGRRGQPAGEAPAVTAYKQALATDAALQGAAPGLASQAMQQNSAITQTGMREAGANRRGDAEIAARTGTEMARLGLDAQRFNETAATGAMERSRMELGMRSLQQEQALRDTLLDPKATPEQRKQAQSSLLALQGKTPGSEWRGIELSGGVDPTGMKLPSRLGLYNAGTGETRLPDGTTHSTQPPNSRPVGTTSTVGGKTAVWDGERWVPRA